MRCPTYLPFKNEVRGLFFQGHAGLTLTFYEGVSDRGCGPPPPFRVYKTVIFWRSLTVDVKTVIFVPVFVLGSVSKSGHPCPCQDR